jgi:hypothetical protein
LITVNSNPGLRGGTRCQDSLRPFLDGVEFSRGWITSRNEWDCFDLAERMIASPIGLPSAEELAEPATDALAIAGNDPR